jgi:hypothetical protein
VSDATNRQQLPTTSGISEDVLESLRDELPDDVFAFLEERVLMGEKKYGSRLKTFNGRDPWIDAKQEAADGIMYGRQIHNEGGTHAVYLAFLQLFGRIMKWEKEARESQS